MRYYLVAKEETDLKIVSELWCIGEESFNSFYPKTGWPIFNELIDKSTTENNLLDYYDIVNQSGRRIPIDKFMDMLSEMKMKKEL